MSSTRKSIGVMAEGMTKEEIQITQDLVNHGIDKLMHILMDITKLSGNPVTAAAFSLSAIKVLMTALSVFSVDGIDEQKDRGQNYRAVQMLQIGMLEWLSEIQDHKEAAQVLSRLKRNTNVPGVYEVFRFLASMKL